MNKIIETLQKKPQGLKEKFIQLKHQVEIIREAQEENKAKKDDITKITKEIKQLLQIINNRIYNELIQVEDLPDDLRNKYIDDVVNEIVFLKETEARLNDMLNDLNKYFYPAPVKNNVFTVPKKYTLENVDFSNQSNLELKQLYKVTLSSGKIRYGIYNGEGYMIDGSKAYTFKTNRGEFSVVKSGSLLYNKPQKIEKVITNN